MQKLLVEYKMVQSLGKQSGCSSKCQTELPFDQAIPLLDIHPQKMKTYAYTKTSTRMLFITLCETANRWKQPKSPPVDERINKTWHIHTVLLSHENE